MLVLSRKKGESILLGDSIELSILEVSGDTIKIGISAPADIRILRQELYASVENVNIDAKNVKWSAADLKNQFNKIRKK
ncbi:carbon storage regulator [Paenibacillus sp. GCM10027627]|uniref:carbon storage regulator n=1 Tax=unclassified Paenibacillus TaxID=185978 RepID=UPI00362D23AF